MYGFILVVVLADSVVPDVEFCFLVELAALNEPLFRETIEELEVMLMCFATFGKRDVLPHE